MRIWTLHPKYLDSKGLVALWREALLAQKVLQGKTKGYRNHPQLIRFQELSNSLGAIAAYLRGVHHESLERGYRFDEDKIVPKHFPGEISETEGQLVYEWKHLLRKLEERDPERYQLLADIKTPDPHPLFSIIPGGIRDWEVVA
jgi:hypothetical protein